jgi:prepilin-type processing-associated H-X9-DG protein
MALARLKSIEALRYYAPGEWGKLLGLDRAPEVRTLRVKVKTLADQNQAFSWSSELCKEWMADAPQEAAVLYVDGHVRVYYGNTKQLPKHYIARERLCLSATADYWVNAMDLKSDEFTSVL